MFKHPSAEAENPFSIEWLSEHFGLKISDVKNAKFDDFGIMYEIYFHELLPAQQFSETLTKAGCFPQIFGFSKSVALNRHNKDRIIGATKILAQLSMNPPSVSSKPSQDFHNPSTSRPSFTMPSFSMPSSTPQGMPIDKAAIIPIPFNIQWLAENYGLNPMSVEKAEFNFELGDSYKITFINLAEAKLFAERIKQKADCNVKVWNFSNSIEIGYYSNDKILRGVGERSVNMNPFNLEFFVNYFGLDKIQVKDISTTSSFFEDEFKIYFHSRDGGEKFRAKMEALKCYPRWDWQESSISFGRMVIFRLLKAAAGKESSIVNFRR